MGLTSFGGGPGGSGGPPSGVAGGDLSGTYPNPTVKGLTGSGSPLTAKVRAPYVDWATDDTGTHGAVSAGPPAAVAVGTAAFTLASVAMPPSSCYTFDLRVTMRSSAGDLYYASLSATYQRIASAAPTLVGVVTTTERKTAGAATSGAWLADFNVNGNAIDIRAKAAAGVSVTVEGSYARNA